MTVQVEVPAGKTIIVLTAPAHASPEEIREMQRSLWLAAESRHDRIGIVVFNGWKVEVFGATPTAEVVPG